jgi:hypothetical protein
MTDRDLFKQALEALELLAWCENPATRVQVRKPRDGGPIVTVYPHKVATDAAAPLRERLAREAWQGLTDEEIRSLPQWFPSHETAAVMPLIRAIEAKLKEKNS